MEKKDKLNYYNFLNSLPKKINKLYFEKLKGKFKLNNKSNKKNGFDPVTNIDRALELFLRKEITKKFPAILELFSDFAFITLSFLNLLFSTRKELLLTPVI